MVKTTYQYNCDICGRAYTTVEEAQACEARMHPATIFPRGLIFQANVEPGWESLVYVLKIYMAIGHEHSIECWTVDDVNKGSMEAIEARTKIITLEMITFVKPPQAMRGLVAVMRNDFMIGYKGMVPIELAEWSGWTEGKPQE